MDFKELSSTIGYAMQDAYNNIELHNIHSYLEHFFKQTDSELNPDSSELTPVEIKLSLNDRQIAVPLAALTHNFALNLDEIKVKLNIETTPDLQQVNATSWPGINNKQEEPTQTGQIEFTFKREDSPEGIARIKQELHKFI